MTTRDETLAEFVIAIRNWVNDNTNGGEIPDHMIAYVARYLAFGELFHDDDFLCALFEDRAFSEVIPLADHNNTRCLLTWHRLLYNMFPGAAHGSIENVKVWCKDGGQRGTMISYQLRYFRKNEGAPR